MPSGPGTTEPAPTTTVELGEPFRLYTHCGIRYTRYADRDWVADEPADDPTRAPGPDGGTRYDGYVSGRMARVDDHTLRFTVDPGTTTGGPSVVTFRPTTDPIPLCE
ncbi:hypothetical protein Acsp05_40740 [Actinokineospora sp. NBRC 105648]|nr:hypothetical protein Acsp05_40740 [Actinokineospora sp. NBRC 105648]